MTPGDLRLRQGSLTGAIRTVSSSSSRRWFSVSWFWCCPAAYDHSKAEIVGILDRILQTEQFKIEHDLLVRRSLEGYRNGKTDFSDYLIGEISRASGCLDTVTFDRALKEVRVSRSFETPQSEPQTRVIA